jgi:TnpA family transposase
VELSELLGEVDAWTGFSRVLLGPEPAAAQRALLYAALLAAACNIPLTDMARSTSLDYQALWWVASNYLREDALKQATTCLVNYQYRQPLAAAWGGGTLSSSDGQRFPVRGHVRAARALPRYYGYGQGLTFYTHTADQYSQFGSRAIASTVRDATYVLDEVLGNETELPLLEHTTDTHGYTDLVFALFDLLGLRFSPRLRDLKDQRLCKIQGCDLVYPSLKFTARFHPEFVRRHWDELLRVAASLKLGYVTSSLLISKLQAYPRQHQLTTLLQEYGRLLKTNFILRYLQSQPLRRRIHAQLNKGEQLHALRSWLWFGGDGALRRQQDEQQQETVRCLNLLTNLVVVWNTVYMQEVVTQLRQEGREVAAEDLRFLSPARYRHINRLGRYSFLPDETALQAGLRPLRTGA